jgi:hypothetical protein
MASKEPDACKENQNQMNSPQELIAEADREILMTVKEYAHLFRLHPGSVYRSIAKGTFKRPLAREGWVILIRVPADLAARLRRAA